MKKALVLGASGGMGSALVEELLEAGIEVVAFARTEEKLKRLFRRRAQILVGDVFSEADLHEAAKGVDVIFHAVNIPYYQWAGHQLRLMQNVINASEKAASKLVIVDNIYAYGPGMGTLIKEDAPKVPLTKKGNIRLEVENLVREAQVPWMIAHFPDFYGPNAEHTVLGQTLQGAAANKRGIFIGDKRKPREYIYTPDGAKALLSLAIRPSAYGQTWNIPGAGVISGEEIIRLLKGESGYDKRVITVTKGMVRMLGLFDKMMREFVEMMYLYEQPVVLSGAKFEREIGPVPTTSYKDGIGRTMEAMAGHRS
ncbi:SDR family NAD(P)-dependent oxidoreductase [Halobacillus sp. BAB-2008]|uniref:SDR family NAD(P)-dependent oxidoreductase n=1 Tax=Halobacillus sp. BAB-2008 TaxID=1246484 RepID=UPI0002A50436|nr:SDR family NAD(P)-dependent oxidoreductase [Halobacillus sp. BAB-2008]ELK45954.1 50S ribosomal protein L11 [Halobacillus sp. BAB-2008]